MSQDRTEKLSTMPIPRLLLSMCSQTTMSVMLFSLYSLADTFFVARGIGAHAAGAVALSAPVVQIIGAFASTVGAGGASIISRALGKRDMEEAGFTAANTFLLFWTCSLLFSIVGLIFLDPMLTAMAARATLMPYAKGYTRIILLGAVTATGFSSLIRAEGNIKFSIAQWIIPTLVNLALDPLFIFVCHMGVEGAALATVISQISSTALSMYYFLFSKWHAYPIRRRHFKIKPRLMRQIVLLGSPSLLSQLFASGFLVAINNRIGSFGGADAISAFGIIGRLRSFLSMPIVGIVQGLQPVVGYNYAAKAYSRVQEAMRVTVSASVIYGIAALAVCRLIPAQMLRFFITEQEIITIGIPALRAVALSLPFTGAITIAASYFQSTGKVGAAFILPTVGVLLVSLPSLYILSSLFSLTGIWYTHLASDAVMFTVSLAVLVLSLKKLDIEKKGVSAS